MFEDQMEKIKNCQEETFLCVKKLNKFLFNPSWADALRDNINFNEIEIFHEYPMKFTKQFCFRYGICRLLMKFSNKEI